MADEDGAGDAAAAAAPTGPLKRPKTAYFMFMDDARKMPEHAGLKVSDLGKRIGEAWKAMPADEKAVRVCGPVECGG
jgi:hypothetical protein